jgi:hypothetical protein
MKDENYPNYIEIKQIVIGLFDKELVLDYAPSCYQASKTLEEFVSRMKDSELARLKHFKEVELNEIHHKVLLVKTVFLKIETQKRGFIRSSQYEKAASTREIQKKVQKRLVDLRTELESRFDQLEDHLSNYNEKLKIKNVLLEFKTIDTEYKRDVCNQLNVEYIRLKSQCEELRKEHKFKEANSVMEKYVDLGRFLDEFSK